MFKSTKSKQLLWWGLAVAASIPVFYILTSGPIILVYVQLNLDRVIPPGILEDFYGPLHVLYDSKTLPAKSLRPTSISGFRIKQAQPPSP